MLERRVCFAVPAVATIKLLYRLGVPRTPRAHLPGSSAEAQPGLVERAEVRYCGGPLTSFTVAMVRFPI